MNRPTESASRRTDRSRSMLWLFPNQHGMELRTADGMHLATIALTGDPSKQPEELAAQLVATRQSFAQRFTSVILVLPRFAYTLKYFTLPACHPSELREALENQIELNSMFAADEVQFDSFPTAPFSTAPFSTAPFSTALEKPTVAGHVTHGLYIVPKSTLAPWKQAIEAAHWNLTVVTTQTQVAVDAVNFITQASPHVIVVANETGVELILSHNGAARVSRFVESVPNEPIDRHRIAFELHRMLGTASGDQAEPYTHVHVVGSLAEDVIKQLTETNPELAERIHHQGAILSGVDSASHAGVMPAGRINLVRATKSISPETVRKRRRVRLAAIAILALLSGLLVYDRLVHRYDDAIQTLAAEIAANEQLLARGQSLEDIYQHLDERRNLQRDWLADLDAVCRELEQEDAVRLTTIRGETTLDQRPATLRFSGVAPDSSTVTRLIERYASDATNVDVTPLGLRPYLNEGVSGVQFDLQLKRTTARSQEARP